MFSKEVFCKINLWSQIFSKKVHFFSEPSKIGPKKNGKIIPKNGQFWEKNSKNGKIIFFGFENRLNFGKKTQILGK
tara:strand:+ start:115 stop:342 length:228 start_codon:yes stop_codon:yes gene_type:complete